MREKLLALLRQRPFQPFRLYPTDGRTFDILYPRNNIAGRSLFTIGVPDKEEPEHYAEYFVEVDYPQIRQIETLPAAAS
jgi:hypothetical protein